MSVCRSRGCTWNCKTFDIYIYITGRCIMDVQFSVDSVLRGHKLADFDKTVIRTSTIVVGKARSLRDEINGVYTVYLWN